jgi:hypothetical protein
MGKDDTHIVVGHSTSGILTRRLASSDLPNAGDSHETPFGVASDFFGVGRKRKGYPVGFRKRWKRYVNSGPSEPS